MSWTIAGYVGYLVITVPLTVWVASTLSRNGRVFLADVFGGDDALADAVNRLLVVGFYLLNLGFVSLYLRSGGSHSAEDVFDMLSVKVGVVLLTRVQRDQPAAASPSAPLERKPVGAEESREPTNASKEDLRHSDADAGPVLGAKTGEKGAGAASSTEPLPRHPMKPGRSPAPKTVPSRGASQPKDSGIVDLRVE